MRSNGMNFVIPMLIYIVLIISTAIARKKTKIRIGSSWNDLSIGMMYRVFTKNWHKIVFAVFTQPVRIASSIQHEQIASSFLCYNIQLLNACGASIGHSVNLCASAAPQALADFSCDANHFSIHLIPFLGDQLSLFSASKTSTYTGVLNRP